MKKTLLLSVVASGIIYAGGNIAPAQPVAPQAAPAACDFWGVSSFAYRAQKLSTKGDSWGAKDNYAMFKMALGVEKKLGYGFGIGAELDHITYFDGKLNKDKSISKLAQLYATYTFGNTTIKAGRQTLPKALSPWAWSYRDAGYLKQTFNAITIVNNNLQDTTLVAAWVPSVFTDKGNTKINGSNKGLFMIGALNKSLPNTTNATSIYYMPKNGNKGKAFSIWNTTETKMNDIELGLQLVYTKADKNSMALIKGATGTKASYSIAGYIGTNFGALNARIYLDYINDGDATLNLGGTSALWGRSLDKSFSNDVVAGTKQKVAKLALKYKFQNNTSAYFDVALDKPDSGKKTAYGLITGYKFMVKDVHVKVEYRYVKNKDFTKRKDQRFRVQALYKF